MPSVTAPVNGTGNASDDLSQARTRFREWIDANAPPKSAPPSHVPLGAPATFLPRFPDGRVMLPNARDCLITPGCRHLVHRDRLVTRAELQRSTRRVRTAVARLDDQAANLLLALADRVAALEAQVRQKGARP